MREQEASGMELQHAEARKRVHAIGGSSCPRQESASSKREGWTLLPMTSSWSLEFAMDNILHATGVCLPFCLVTASSTSWLG